MRRCVTCGQPFKPKNPQHKYCDKCSPWKNRNTTEYDAETLAWLRRRSAENMAMFFRDELRAVQAGRRVHGNILRNLCINGLIKRREARRPGYTLTPLGMKLLKEIEKW